MKCFAESYCKRDRSECSELCGGYRVLRALYTLSRIPVRYQYNIALKPEPADVKAFEALNHCVKLGIDTIVSDHHTMDQPVPCTHLFFPHF